MNEKVSGIYKIINRLDGRYYVGSSNDILTPNSGRKYLHFWALKNNRHCNRHLQSAWNKYGESSFDFVIIEECSSVKQVLLDSEQKYLDIAKNEQNRSYNLSFIANRVEMTDETKRLIGLSKIGNKNCLGRHCTQTTREKISMSNTGKKRSIEARDKMSKSKIGKYVGVNSPSFGAVRSAETRAKISEKCQGLFVGKKSYRYDHTNYSFRNIETGAAFTGTRHEFYTKYPHISKSNLGGIISGKSNRKTVNGWERVLGSVG